MHLCIWERSNKKALFKLLPTIQILFLTLSCTVTLGEDVFTASEDCPCLDDPFEYYNISRSQGNCSDGYYTAYYPYYDSVSCLKNDYGVGQCKAWDAGSSDYEECALPEVDRPDWCNSMWCWVATGSCQRPHHQTESSSSLDDIEYWPFSYSYETCGNADQLTAAMNLEALRNKHLRLTYPDNSSDGYNLISSSSGSEDERDGAMVAIQVELFKRFNITYEVLQITEKSKKTFPTSGSYTQCAHDVMLNETDLCVGPFKVTAERLAIAQFAAALVPVTHVDENVSLLDYFYTPFQPFTVNAWCWILLKYVCSQEMSSSERVRKSTGWIFNNVYYGGRSFAAGDTSNASDKPSTYEKCILFGFSLFGLIILTAYTAQSAAALVLDTSAAIYNTMDDVIEANVKVCLTGNYKDTALGMFPEIKDNILDVDGIPELFEALSNHTCEAGWIDAESFYTRQSTSDEDCDKGITELILSASVSWPVRDEFMDALSYGLSNLVRSGFVSSTIENYKFANVGPSSCNDDNADDSDKNERLSADEIVFPVTLSILCTSLGGIIFLYQKYNARKLKNETSLPAEDDVESHDVGVSSDEMKSLITQVSSLSATSKRIESLLIKNAIGSENDNPDPSFYSN